MALTDRMARLRAGIVANVVVPHPEYVQFATHYQFRPDFCEGSDPESKGLVENLCGYAQTDLLVPALLEPEKPNLKAWNDAARAWLPGAQIAGLRVRGRAGRRRQGGHPSRRRRGRPP